MSGADLLSTLGGPAAVVAALAAVVRWVAGQVTALLARADRDREALLAEVRLQATAAAERAREAAEGRASVAAAMGEVARAQTDVARQLEALGGALTGGRETLNERIARIEASLARIEGVVDARASQPHPAARLQ